MNLAYLKSGVVVRIAPEGWDPGSLDFDTTVPATGASVGDTWDGERFVKAAQLPVEPMLRIDFMRRFTPAEWLAIDAARVTDGMVRYVMALFDAAVTVRLDHPDTQAAIGYFQHVGLLTPERGVAILDPENT